MPNDWQKILDEIKNHISGMAFATYFTKPKFISLDGGILRISAPNPFSKQQLDSKYRQDILNAAAAVGLPCSGLEVTIEQIQPKESRFATEIVPNEPLGRQKESTISTPTQNAPVTPNLSTDSSDFGPTNRGYTPINPAQGYQSAKNSFARGGVQPIAPRSVPNSITHGKKPRFSKEDSGLNPKYLLSSYVVGGNNDLAMSAAQAVIEDPGKKYNPLFLYGGPGVGKTHLVQGIGNEIKTRHPEMRVLYITIEQFYSDFVTAMKNKINGFAEKYRDLDVLIVDDFQFIVGKEKSQEEFFHTFNELDQHNKQVIITSDRLPSEIATLDSRLASRLMQGMPIDIQLPDFETRCAIIKLKAEMSGDDIDDWTTEYLANSIQTNIRELEGALNRILAFATLRGISPREVVEGDSGSSTPTMPVVTPVTRNKTMQPRAVIEIVAEYYGISLDDLLGKSRVKDIKTARQIAMYLLSEELRLSTVGIGREFGKDHTTIMHGLKVIKDSIKTDFNLRSQISELREKING